MNRIVQPEILDTLESACAEAVQSRRDLHRINYVMGNIGAIERSLREIPGAGTLMEIGCGDGQFMLSLCKRMRRVWPHLEVTLVDRSDSVPQRTLDGIRELGWNVRFVRADVFEYLRETRPVDVIMTNLFLHHFENDQLSLLLSVVAAKAVYFIACEPRRLVCPRFFAQLLRLIGACAVTLHDAEVSIRAGFKGGELSLLWPKSGWTLEEGKGGLFSHKFMAVRKKRE